MRAGGRMLFLTRARLWVTTVTLLLGIASTKVAAQQGPTTDNSTFTIGWFGGVSWSKWTGSLAGANPPTHTSIALPVPQYLVQWNAARELSLGFHLGGSYVNQGSSSSAYSTFYGSD